MEYLIKYVIFQFNFSLNCYADLNTKITMNEQITDNFTYSLRILFSSEYVPLF